MPKEIAIRDADGNVLANVLVDDSDYDYLSKWAWTLKVDPSQNGENGSRCLQYAIACIRGMGHVKMHQIVMQRKAMNGEDVSNDLYDDEDVKKFGIRLVIDHIDGNGINNTRANLRMATIAQNVQRKIKGKNKDTEYLGIRKRDSKRWQANCSHATIGTFNTEEEAARAYDKYVLVHYGKYANTNGLAQFEEVREQFEAHKLALKLELHASRVNTTITVGNVEDDTEQESTPSINTTDRNTNIQVADAQPTPQSVSEILANLNDNNDSIQSVRAELQADDGASTSTGKKLKIKMKKTVVVTDNENQVHVPNPLPTGIHIKTSTSQYVVDVTYSEMGKIPKRVFNDYKDAENHLKEIKSMINDYNKKKEETHRSVEIERNDNGDAIIKVGKMTIIVDDDKWHDLKKKTLSQDKENVRIYDEVSRNRISLREYIRPDLKPLTDTHNYLSHFDGNFSNYRYDNIKIMTMGQIKRRKNMERESADMKKCICEVEGRFIVNIKVEGKNIYGGSYGTEDEAKLAYNILCENELDEGDYVPYQLDPEFLETNRENIVKQVKEGNKANTSSKYKHVTWKKKDNRWLAHMKIKNSDEEVSFNKYTEDEDLAAALIYKFAMDNCDNNYEVAKKYINDPKINAELAANYPDAEWRTEKNKTPGIIKRKDGSYRVVVKRTDIGSAHTLKAAKRVYNEKAPAILGDAFKPYNLDDSDDEDDSNNQ